MAIAGKVAITPGYEWSLDVAYDKLVVVTYGNNVYLSTKPSTGIEPTNEEYWMLLIENVTAEDLAELQTTVENIINGTTPVAKATDADTVDGYHAKDFYKLGAVDNLPSGADLNTYINDGQWGTDSDAIAQSILNKPSEVTSKFRLRVERILRTQSTGYFRQIIKMSNSGIEYERIMNNGVFGKWSILYLPLTGGTLSGNLEFSGTSAKSRITQYNGATVIRNYSDNSNYGDLAIDLAGNLKFNYSIGGTYKGNTVLHTGNKPTGTYTGNGSATSRTIQTGGIGNVIFLKSASSNLGFFSRNGGVMYNLQSKTFEYFYEDKMYFRDGNLYIATDSSLVNYNGSIFTYYVV